jgi:prepilin-type processing-associated H-X9-DG protein
MGAAILLYDGDYDGNLPPPLSAADSSMLIGNVSFAGYGGTSLFGTSGGVPQPVNLGVMFTGSYLSDRKSFYCASMHDQGYGGISYSNVGWRNDGKPNITTGQIAGSYYYRGGKEQGWAADRNKLQFFLNKGKMAALWDCYHSDSPYFGDWRDSAGSLNQGYHREGANIAFFDGSTGRLPASEWSISPINILGGIDLPAAVFGTADFRLAADAQYGK